MTNRKSTWLNRVLMLCLALPPAVVVIFDVVNIVKQPLILTFLGLSVVLCFLGSRMESRSAVNFVSRVLLLVVALALGLVAVEFMALGEGLNRLVGVALLTLCAGGIKYLLSLQSRYWIVFVVAAVALVALYYSIHLIGTG